MSLAVSCAFDFSHFGLTDWQPADSALVNNGSLRIIDPRNLDLGKSSTKVSADTNSSIEWRFAPSQHIGAMTPHLLYRNAIPTLSNSFLSVIPSGQTGMIADVDIVARMFTPNACHPKMLHIYQGWVIARLTDLRSLDFYMAAIYRNDGNSSDVVSIWRVTANSSRVKVAAMQLGNKIDWSKPWHCRFNVAGHALKAKWWSYDAIEPDNWDLRSTDDALTRPGMIGFASTVHGEIIGNVWGLDWYAWSSDPNNPAPLYPHETVG